MTEMTRINTVTPSITPTIEISVMIERNVRFGFKYRSARKRLNGSFNSGLSWRQTQPNSTARLLGECVCFQFLQRDKFERGGVRGFEINRTPRGLFPRLF